MGSFLAWLSEVGLVMSRNMHFERHQIHLLFISYLMHLEEVRTSMKDLTHSVRAHVAFSLDCRTIVCTACPKCLFLESRLLAVIKLKKYSVHNSSGKSDMI